ncbi:2,3,4,5-tetrahydropyridine-2,6-dicarboxylate N-succinyltransferase [Corynebacterium kutscheri]|uniref:2,3,4,5-tetrahydropyridine-2,6-dicarboxylate N-succinyltransferase n=1 Tax=Corynebacterium kutscheri TaxID=35755 RepID=A0A0F6R0F8_9CORY|nr:DapH/DapD/GlmU-related protein [Corynebacterium kutscheri]AKE41717.1 tetrahydrodipicolinate N-succinyltransferase [Corynebacterium kutscheri]VEH08993.1 2,3,4,5-tetrahydropyridine-2,6-dicarboxylate N-succinyltransferase [Corynebacterium kutscheri]VEH10044.1 2,3,4,5-tetrahydropyridine-2,6-dicarboxylate N-succinyltransferase [Corynebacterium kutscheri]VEH80125.1 2,3,4,5-tetrahydropyridine-2,6-dicarboxylate N-succinyltransferase [Corynebacterium kutscheri]
MSLLGAHAIGIANIAMDATVLDTWYPSPELTTHITHPTGSVRLGAHDLSPKLLNLVRLDEDRMVEQVAVRTTITDLNAPPVDAHDVYLRLHLLSHRLVKPHELNMDKCLELLATVVWTNKGPCLTDNFEQVRTSLRSRGLIHVYGIDRLPRMVDYVVPSGVNITEAERVRLGAYLSPGTRVLREGFVSYNAGSLGPCRIEGRLSSGVVIGENTDLGISSSLISPKESRQLKVGKDCTFGVGTSVLCINLGDNVHIGHNIVLDRETPLYSAATGDVIPAAQIEFESNITIRMEAGHPEPVIRKL